MKCILRCISSQRGENYACNFGSYRSMIQYIYLALNVRALIIVVLSRDKIIYKLIKCIYNLLSLVPFSIDPYTMSLSSTG